MTKFFYYLSASISFIIFSSLAFADNPTVMITTYPTFAITQGKEMVEIVQPDIVDYQINNTVSPALAEVVNKIAIQNGVSTDAVYAELKKFKTNK